MKPLSRANFSVPSGKKGDDERAADLIEFGRQTTLVLRRFLSSEAAAIKTRLSKNLGSERINN